MFDSDWTEGLFCPISPSSREIKLQFTVRAEEWTQTTPAIKGPHDPCLRHTGPHKRRRDIQSGRNEIREILYGNMQGKLRLLTLFPGRMANIMPEHPAGNFKQMT
jgi:hypothetical protein